MKLLSASLFALSGCNGFHPESASSRSFSSLGSLPKNEEVVAPLDWRKTATSIVVAATLGWGVACGPAYADDFADFSLPSYEAVSRAEVNTNLKGNKFLIDEASSASSASSDATAATTPAATAKSAEEIKAEKAAEKAAEKEARERQKAAVEAAAKAVS